MKIIIYKLNIVFFIYKYLAFFSVDTDQACFDCLFLATITISDIL